MKFKRVYSVDEFDTADEAREACEKADLVFESVFKTTDGKHKYISREPTDTNEPEPEKEPEPEPEKESEPEPKPIIDSEID